MAIDNSTILDHVKLLGSNDYQQRVPFAVQDGPEAVYNALEKSPFLMNEFQNNLFTMIGKQIIEDRSWKNPLSVFKSDAFSDGKTVQEIAAHFVERMQYDANASNFLEKFPVDTETAAYGVNRRDVYAATVNTLMLKQSFLQPNGIANFISMVLESVSNSSEYDEYNIMLHTLKLANQKNPFYNVSSPIADPANPTTEELKNLSKNIRVTVENMTVSPTVEYNAFGVPVAAKRDDLVLLITPTISASLDVEVLADAFNPSKTDIAQKVIIVREFPWKDVHAVLIDKKGFIFGDALKEVRSFENPRDLTTTFFYHAHGGYAISKAAPIAVFSSTEGTQLGVVDVKVTGISAELQLQGSKVLGISRFSKERARIVATGIGSATANVDLDGEFIVPANYTTEIQSSGAIGSGTYVDNAGYLHLGNEVKDGDTLTITVKSAYLNPSSPLKDATEAVTTTVSVNVGEIIFA